MARLYYVGVDDREERITDAYDKTFGWIFADQDVSTQRWSDFRAWLTSETPLYWIPGKAGSGRSILMKFICHEQHPATPVNTPKDRVIEGFENCNPSRILHRDTVLQSRC
jgi:hypothetical protein